MAVKTPKKESLESIESVEAKKETKKQKSPIFVNIARFVYVGSEPYFHKDEKGNLYTFYQNDTILINEGESARYFDYKENLFQRVLNA